MQSDILVTKRPTKESYSQGIPAKSYVKISSTFSISNTVFDVILEGSLVGLTVDYMSEILQLNPKVVRRVRVFLKEGGFVPIVHTGSRTVRYKPVKQFTRNGILLPPIQSKFWNLGPQNSVIKPETFNIPVFTEKDFIQVRKFTSKYLSPTTISKELENLQMIETVECEGPIKIKSDFIASNFNSLENYTILNTAPVTIQIPTQDLSDVTFVQPIGRLEEIEKVKVEEPVELPGSDFDIDRPEFVDFTLDGVRISISRHLLDTCNVTLTTTGIKIV